MENCKGCFISLLGLTFGAAFPDDGISRSRLKMKWLLLSLEDKEWDGAVNYYVE
jgi:hypothetical protein